MFDFLFRKKQAIQAQLPFATDIHAHIVPGVDDGADDLEESIQLVRALHKMGVNRIIATPHRTDETFENSVETIQPAFDQLKQALATEQIPVTIDYSFEYRMDEGFMQLLKENKIRPLSKNYVLVENSFIQALWNLDELLFDLKLKGFIPILAHPERYAYYHQHKEVYDKLHHTGCLFQVNILSFAGHYGKPVKETALWLLKKGYIDFCGTDIHHQGHATLIEKFLQSKEYQKIKAQLTLHNETL